MAIGKVETYRVKSGNHSGKICFIVHEWSGDCVSVRFGTPTAQQGEIIISKSDLELLQPGQWDERLEKYKEQRLANLKAAKAGEDIPFPDNYD